MDVEQRKDGTGIELIPIRGANEPEDSRDVVWANRVIDRLRQTEEGRAVFNGTRAVGNVALSPEQSQLFYYEAKRQAEEVAKQNGSDPNLPDEFEKVDNADMVAVRFFSEKYSDRAQ